MGLAESDHGARTPAQPPLIDVAPRKDLAPRREHRTADGEPEAAGGAAMVAAVDEVLVEIDVAALDEDEPLLRRLATHDLLLRDVGAASNDPEPVQAVQHG